MRSGIALLLLFTMSVFPMTTSGQDQAENSRKVVNKVVPVYPDLARRMQLHGTVRVEAVVAPNGSVKSTRVIGGNPVLAVAAEDAVRRWKYAPGATDSTTLVELRFGPH
jgi:TonB family protein